MFPLRTTLWSVAAMAALTPLAGCDDAGGGSAAAYSAPAVSTPVREATSAPPVRETTSGPTATAAPAGGFTGLEMAKSGGIAGVSESVKVDADGSWQRLDDRTVVGSGKLTSAQLTRRQQLAADPALAAEAGREVATPRCADGFHYTLSVGFQLIRYEQCGPTDSPRLTTEIIDLVTEATS
jgi:hypothetical protein